MQKSTDAPWHTVSRTQIAHLPTPLEPLPRLSRELDGPMIWLKRDDCTGLATGGNKTRKLEYLLAEALEQNCDTVMTFGAVQSNHARQTAAACAKLGLQCHLALTRQVPSGASNYTTGGNILLGKLTGAHLHVLEPDTASDYVTELSNRLEQDGRRVYRIPAGGSNALGALGYARCAEELSQQCAAQQIAPSHIVHASSSAGTQAGLIYGMALLQDDQDSPQSATQILGINVYHPDPADLRTRLRQLLEKMGNRFGQNAALRAAEVHVNHAYIGEGYGLPTPETLQAISLAAELEGVLFDPVYSGKALAALIDQINIGNLANSSDVVMLHTGGSAALNVYTEQFSAS
ncbi:MAG: D-cysteine desulfhydrase family protein [Pseudomonadota bacterium]